MKFTISCLPTLQMPCIKFDSIINLDKPLIFKNKLLTDDGRWIHSGVHKIWEPVKCSCIVKHSIIWQNLVQRHAEEWKTERKICLSIYELVNIWHTDNLYCNSGNQTHVLVSSKPEMDLKNYICLNSKIIKNQLIAYQYCLNFPCRWIKIWFKKLWPIHQTLK